MTLDELDIGKKAYIKNIEKSSSLSRRLFDIGMIKDTLIECVLKSPLGDPKAYAIRGTTIAIRKEDAKKVNIIPIGGDKK